MISKLKIIPLGGLGEIGKNMTAYEFGSDIIVVDCGMGESATCRKLPPGAHPPDDSETWHK